MNDIREQLYILCVEHLKKRETEIRAIIAEAQEAGENETKNSAGDKFETGREVLQQEIEMNLARLSELHKMQTILDRIMPAQKEPTACHGSVVYTNNGNFYLAIGAGKLKVGDTPFYAVSAESPVGSQLVGKTAGQEFALNDKKFLIEKVA
ncbi:MAG: 3-oxoacyl-ACP synthase [Flavipsychrobacter sp.]|jgi:transcription elongation GreA/GreB family factor|nr:3-oxoacyl-ACP synthase [Flavipsychrobacter sp.]